MRVGGLHHVALKAKDVAHTALFYRDVLGMDELKRHDDDRGLRSIWLQLGDQILMVERSDGHAAPVEPFDADPPGWHLLALRIPRADREAWASHLEAQQVAIVHQTDFTLYVRDPEGHRIGLSWYGEADAP